MGEAHPLLDIVIPACNERYWLKDLFSTLSTQDTSDIAIHLVCSGCTAELCCLDPVPPGVSIIRTGLGVSHARNRGALAGRAPWILFLDADVLLPRFFLIEVRNIIKSSDSDAISFSFYADTDDLMLRLGTRLTYYYLRVISRLLFPSLPGFAMLVRRKSFLLAGAFDTTLSIAEDVEFSRRLHRMGFTVSWCTSLWLVASTRRFDTGLAERFKTLRLYALAETIRLTPGLLLRAKLPQLPRRIHPRAARRRFPDTLPLRPPAHRPDENVDDAAARREQQSAIHESRRTRRLLQPWLPPTARERDKSR